MYAIVVSKEASLSPFVRNATSRPFGERDLCKRLPVCSSVHVSWCMKDEELIQIRKSFKGSSLRIVIAAVLLDSN